MNWTLAIERNRAALVRILAGLLALAGYADGRVAARLPQGVYRSILRGLRPLELAVRRLIAVAARGLAVKLDPPRPGSKGSAAARARKRGAGRALFKLFDSRKPFRLQFLARGLAKPQEPPGYLFAEAEKRHSNIYDGSVTLPWFRPPPAASPAPVPEPDPDDGTVDARRLGRRLAAAKAALENIPREARRMALWEARREAAPSPKFTSPLRSGRPPGLRKNPRDEVERVLRECHDLAFHALKPDTS